MSFLDQTITQKMIHSLWKPILFFIVRRTIRFLIGYLLSALAYSGISYCVTGMFTKASATDRAVILISGWTSIQRNV